MKFNFSRLSRKTSSSKLIPEIDGLRFLAIITVVIFHLNTAYARGMGIEWLQSIQLLGGHKTPLAVGWWMVRLDMGVKVFFAISGFVLALPFLQHYLNGQPKVNLKQYFTRRLARLEPPFIVSLFIFFFVHIVLLNADAKAFTGHLMAGLIYGHVFIYGEPNPINPVTWSLETEAQFYILVPLIFAGIFIFKRAFSQILVVLLLIMASAVFKFHYNGLTQVSLSIAAYFMNFGVGILFAMFYLKVSAKRWNEKGFVFDLLGIAACLGLFFFYKPQHYYGTILGFNISLFMLFIATFKGKMFNFFFTRKWVYTIGGMCYSIYLLHYAFFHLWTKFTAGMRLGVGYGWDLLLQLTLAIPAVLCISALYFVFIERPCMDKDWIYKVKAYFRVKERIRSNSVIQQ